MPDVSLSAEISVRVSEAERNLSSIVQTVQNSARQIDASASEIGSSIATISPATSAALSGVSDSTRQVGMRFNELTNNVTQSLSSLLSVITGNAELFGRTLSTQQQQIGAYRAAINSLLAGGYSTASNEVTSLVSKIDSLSASISRQEGLLERQKQTLAQSFTQPVGIIQNLENALTSLQAKLRAATDTKSIDNYNRAITGVQENLNRLRAPNVSQVNNALGSIVPSSRSASFALTNLGRVVQDAPFGFIAIQNNIGPLVDGFGYLAREAAATGTTIRASLLSALAGPAGLGLAIAVVTSAITLFVQHQQKVDSALKNTKKSSDDYVSSLGDLTRAQVSGAQAAQKDLNQLNQLYTLATNNAASTRDRKRAVDELQQQYPAYFGNLKDEIILTGGASDANDRLKTSILQVAQARAAEGILEKNQSRQIENAQKIADLEAERLKTQTSLNAAVAVEKAVTAGLSGNTASSFSGGGGQAFVALVPTGKVNELQKSINESIAKQNNLRTDTNKLADRNLDLINKINKAAEKNGVAAITGSFTEPKGAKAKKVKADPFQPLFGQQSKLNLGEKDALTTSLEGQTTAALDAMSAVREYTDAQINLGIEQRKNNQLFNEQSELFNNITNQVAGSLTEAFTSIISNGANAFDAIISGLGKLIVKLIAATLAAAALAVILSFLPGGGGIGAFAANFSKISAITGGIPKFANGGIVTGPTLALIGEGREHEVVAPMSKFNAMVNNKANEQQGNLSGEFKVKGSDLLLVLSRADAKKGRVG